MAKRKANATKKRGGVSESSDNVQRQTTRRSSPAKASSLSPGSRLRSQPVVVLKRATAPPGPAMNKGDDAVPGSPGHSPVKKRAPGGTTAKRGRAAASATTEKTSESPSRSKPAGENATTAEPLGKTTAKRGRAAASASGPGQKTSESPSRSPANKASPSRSKTARVESPAVATEKRPAKTAKRGRAANRQVAEPQLQQLATQGPHAEADLAKAAGRNAGSPVGSPSTPSKRAGAQAEARDSAGTSTGKQASMRGRASTDKAATAALQQQVHRDRPAGPSKDEEADSESPSPRKRKSLGRPKQPGVTANASKNVDVPDNNSPKPTKGTKRGRAPAAVDTTTSHSQQTEEQGPPAKHAVASASGDGKTPRTAAQGTKQRAKRREPFYYDYIVPWVESQLASEFDSDSDEEDVSCASIDSIIPPAGMLQPYRRKNRLIGAGGSRSSSDDDMSFSPGEDLLSRCEAKFGVDTLPHSTTTTAEAISIFRNSLSNFVVATLVVDLFLLLEV
ncbi:hypothetical protein HPB52_004763 [Rhipicephalus sanguineus]|uniref:Uncharacterized protein n=1 Tax=Rhipicephalus sanguineus TaxID=34632 RepID=A0A9D4SNC2_RHISA|nr:hypothetical protein HPB52_004763 [Rhipicephalus sanguineus]